MRALAASMALSALVSIRPATAEPGDVFTTAAPLAGSAPSAATPLAAGDASVSTRTGGFNYSFPIVTSPGRGKAEPALALQYSSQAATYGTLASHWTLAGLPFVTRDTSEGILESSIKSYRSSMAGGRPLVEVPETGGGVTRYRAQHDTGFVRYERYESGDFWWRALSPDGMTYYFGHHGLNDFHTTGCAIVSDEHAPLTRTEDEFGNAVDYIWRPGAVDGECRIAAILWGHNQAAGVGYFAAVQFEYEATPVCSASNIPVGSQTSYRTGTKIVTGASQLKTIRTAAFDPIAMPPADPAAPIPSTPLHTRTITLTYNTSPGQPDPCTVMHAAYRTLLKIEERAVNTDTTEVVLPPIDFTYNSALQPPATLAQETNPWRFAMKGIFPDTRETYNLGWGYRLTGSSSGWPTVEAMMIDLDGDGLIDRLVNEPFTENGEVRFCQARWWRNPGGGGAFVDNGLIQLPTLKWATDIGQPTYTGGSHARANQSMGVNELCALNYQRTGYVNSHDNGELSCGGAPGCPLTGHCAHGSDCNTRKAGAVGNTFFAWRWFDVDGDRLPDLVGSPIRGGLKSYDLVWGSGVAGDPGGAPMESTVGGNIFGTFPPCPSQKDPPELPYTAKPNDPDSPYTVCNGMFPHFVYLNNGNGVFGWPRTPMPGPLTHEKWGALPSVILYQPVPLEASTGDASILSSTIGSEEGSLDIDGDSYVDAVFRGSNSQTASWGVYLNDGTGQYVRNPSPSSYYPYFWWDFAIGTGYYLQKSSVLPGTLDVVAIEGLTDLNSDGLADHWKACETCQAQFAWNDGTQFRLPSGIPELTTLKPGTESATSDMWIVNGWVNQGRREDKLRELDIDYDGRVDLLKWHPPVQTPFMYFNQGGDYGDAAGAVGWPHGFNHKIVATQDELPYYFAGSGNYAWEIRSDVLDLDGDGIREEIDFGSAFANPIEMWVNRATGPVQPPRLLSSINNNRGAITTITYASMNSATVTQAPEQGRRMPETGWVVQNLTTVDSLANTTTTTSYEYKRPMFSRDDRKKYGFRGFEEVVTSVPTGAQTVEAFGYSVDWTGRLIKQLVIPAPTDMPTPVAGEVRSIEDTTWTEHTLFDGKLKTYHATKSDHWTCNNGQTETACRTNTEGRTQTLTELEKLGELLYQAKTTQLRIDDIDRPGDRKTTMTHLLVATTDDYRVRTEFVTSEERQTDGSIIVYAKAANGWDSSLRVVENQDVWFSNPDDPCTATAQHCARTHRIFDMTTGNLLEHVKPEQWSAGGTAKTVYTYDARKLFVATETNEAALQLDYAYEYGTGTKLLTAGPNVGSCVNNPSTCPVGTTIKEERRIRVDGLGRMLERWEPYSAQTGNVSSYTPVKVETATYVDTMPGGTGPTSVTHTGYVNTSATDSQDVMELDGHGRPIKKTVFVFGTAPTNHVTTFVYDHDGALAQVTVPDPSQNNASTVTYRYEFDSLGRPTSLRRPDAANLGDQSGANIHYDGLVTTTEEFVGLAGGQPAATRTTRDPYGRPVTVEERLTLAPATWATTMYSYDPNDHVAQIVGPAPELVTTTLVHDFAGRRTEITRGSRTRRYGHDRNGNMVSVRTPCSPEPLCDPSYTTTIGYDALDRPSSKYVAPRDLSAADVTLFGLHHERFIWDYGVLGSTGNFKGRLIYWRAYSAASEVSANIVYLAHRTYQPQGQPTLVTEWFQSAGLSISREHLRAYGPTGLNGYTHYKDYIGGSTGATTSTVAYDRRGLPASMTLTPGGAGGTRTIATQTRNVAGLVTKRYAPGIGGPMTFIESNWTYDTLGRVTSQVVQKGPGPEQVARQDLSYWGNDDPRTLDHWLGATNHKHFDYSYDLRHQLAGVDETQHPDAFDASYEYGPPGTPNGSGRFTRARHVAAALPGSDVATRDVLYQYDGDDPEQVTALVHTANPIVAYASYAYDLAGNQTIRCSGALVGSVCTGESMHYLYDGEDQLRRATKKNGVGSVVGSEEYWYDGDGRRAVTVKRDGGGTKTGVIFWIVDVEAHYDGAGVAQRVYSHPSLGTPVARVERTSPTAAAIEFQYHGLANNTLATVANYWGTVNASFIYAPFGEVIEATDAGAPGSGIAQHRRRFNDKYIDELSDLTYYGFRYYDKLSMTWTQADPLFRFAPDLALTSPRRAQLHTFTLNNPLRYLDPDGLDSAGFSSFASHSNGNHVASVAMERPVADGGNTSTTALREMVLSGIALPFREAWDRENIACGGCLEPQFLSLKTQFAPGGVHDAIRIDLDRWEASTTREATTAEKVVGTIIIGAALAASFYGALGAVWASGAVTADAAATGTVAAVHTVHQGFRSFSAFKRAMGPAGPGQAWHHIVEQTTGNVARFGAQAIHNTGNLVRLPHGAGTIHARVSGLYSSIRADITGSTSLTVRQWLSTQSFDAQFAFGQRALQNIGSGAW